MTVRAVHWYEGMFLRPHHFQAEQRHWSHQLNRGEKWDQHYNWGVRSVDLDLEALANHRLVVRALQSPAPGRHPGLAARGRHCLPAIELKAAFERANSVTVFLAVPVLRLGRANTAGGPGRGRHPLPDRFPGAGGREHRRQSATDPGSADEPAAAALEPGPDRLRSAAHRPHREIAAGRGGAAAGPLLHPAAAGLRCLATAGRRHPANHLRPHRQEERAARQPGRCQQHLLRQPGPGRSADLRPAPRSQRSVCLARHPGLRPGHSSAGVPTWS